MSDIDQASIIAQLAAENEALRKVLRESPARELQIASMLNVLVDELTRLGPKATARTLTWAMGRYMRANDTFYEHWFWDRRPKEQEFIAAPEPAAPEPPAAIETTRLELPNLRKRGRPRKEST